MKSGKSSKSKKKKSWINNKINQNINLKSLSNFLLKAIIIIIIRNESFFLLKQTITFAFSPLFVRLPHQRIIENHTIIKYSVNIVWVERCQRMNLRTGMKISNILSWLYYAWNVALIFLSLYDSFHVIIIAFVPENEVKKDKK